MRPVKTRLKESCVKLAMSIYLAENNRCELCGGRANVAHHVIHQSRSNYLRCDQRNLCALCTGCHYKVHSCGHEGILMGELIKRRGIKWFDDLVADSHRAITDNLGYWQEMKAKLDYVYKLQSKGELE